VQGRHQFAGKLQPGPVISSDVAAKGLPVSPAEQLLKELEKENERLRKAVSDLTLEKLILREAASGNF